ncbi:hypothetical protein ACWGFX_30375 [Streptomyces xanthophaeus]|uniref:hypothetical protein n=1 Tax=Streptomyces xanthophaeus TaxID=67385 RepID=UPI00131C0734|nr:hypothetical protein [Streptomyces xanthophaeus]
MVTDESGGDEDGAYDGDTLVFQVLLDGVHVSACREQASAFIDVIGDLLCELGGQPVD